MNRQIREVKVSLFDGISTFEGLALSQGVIFWQTQIGPWRIF